VGIENGSGQEQQKEPAMTSTVTSFIPRAAEILPAYANMIHLVERLHRRLMDVVTEAVGRANIQDVNAVQAIMLYNIADQELTVSELRERDYYMGSNSSYNVKKLVEGGFLCYAKSRIDRRTVRISLGVRGKEVHGIVARAYQKHAATVEQLGGIPPGDFDLVNRSLQRLDRFWSHQIEYKL
jgi:DNA-binding MarR family transcriptional regulator